MCQKRVFWLLLPTFNLWKGDWALAYVSSRDFSSISQFPKILSLFFFSCWALAYVSSRDFSSISQFPRILSLFFFLCGHLARPPIVENAAKILSLTLFRNSWGNSYTKFAILDIKFRFTCGDADLYQNTVKFQHIITRIVELIGIFLLWNLSYQLSYILFILFFFFLWLHASYWLFSLVRSGTQLKTIVGERCTYCL